MGSIWITNLGPICYIYGCQMDTVDGYHMDYLSTYVVIRPTTYVMQVCCQGVLLSNVPYGHYMELIYYQSGHQMGTLY